MILFDELPDSLPTCTEEEQRDNASALDDQIAWEEASVLRSDLRRAARQGESEEETYFRTVTS